MRKILFISLLSFFCMESYAQKYVLISPDSKLSAEIEINQAITIKMANGTETILNLSGLEMVTSQKTTGGWQVKKASRRTANEDHKPLIRVKSQSYKNSYNELDLIFKSNKALTFRLFNEGLAYRFSTSSKDSLTVYKENLNIQFQESDSVRFQSEKSFSSAYESPYEHKKLNEIEAGQLINFPILIEKQNKTFVMITESDLYDYPGMWGKGTGKSEFNITNPPYPRTLKNRGNPSGDGQAGQVEDYIAKVAGTRTFPWRIFAFTDNEEGLIANNLVYLLASPSEMKDVSWIKPGVVMFDWWAKNNIYSVDFKAGVNTETAKYFIDFCAKNNFRYFLFDDGWSPRGNILHEVPGLNMAEVTAYAKSKGVDVMLWVMWSTLQKQMHEAMDQFEKWGIKGIKMDFMNRDDQQMVQFYEQMVSKAAEKKMVVDLHGAYKPSGLSRKYPNLLTREALLEFEQSGVAQTDNTEHHNILPYIRMFTGPMDYIPATMRNSTRRGFKPVADYPMGQGTRAHAMALFVILSSPLTMLPDSPTEYNKEKPCLDFLSKIPVEWDESKLLTGKISMYTVLARRAGTTWFVGAITNKDERTLEISTDFLAKGKYDIEIIADGVNANTAANDYKLTIHEFNAGEKLTIAMAKGGGWLARITPKK